MFSWLLFVELGRLVVEIEVLPRLDFIPAKSSVSSLLSNLRIITGGPMIIYFQGMLWHVSQDGHVVDLTYFRDYKVDKHS